MLKNRATSGRRERPSKLQNAGIKKNTVVTNKTVAIVEPAWIPLQMKVLLEVINGKLIPT